MILNYPNLFCKHLIKLLKILAKSVTKISDMRNELGSSAYLPQLCHKLACIIKSQEHLKHFKFRCIMMTLESQKETLKEIIIEDCPYSTELKALRNCEN